MPAVLAWLAGPACARWKLSVQAFPAYLFTSMTILTLVVTHA